MFIRPANNPLVNVAPDRAGVRRDANGAVPYAQQSNQYTSNPANVDFGPFTNTFGLPADHTGLQFMSQFDRWTPNVSIKSESHSPTMASSACSEYSAAASSSSGEYNWGHPSSAAFTPPTGFGHASFEDTYSDYKDAPFILDYLYPASESPDGMMQGVLGTHSVMDANTQCAPPPLWTHPASGSGQRPWQHFGAAAADVRGQPSTSLCVAGAAVYPYPRAETVPATNGSWNVAPAGRCIPPSYGVPAEGQEGPSTHSYNAIDPSMLAVSRFLTLPPFEDQQQPREQHCDVAPAGAVGLASGTQTSGDLCYHEPSPEPPSPPPSSDGALSPSPGPEKSTEYVSAFKKPAPTKERRRQSTEKVFPCEWPGCNKCESTLPSLDTHVSSLFPVGFARSNNLKVHWDGVHLHKRENVCPYKGCRKAESGFSRKYDLDQHIAKHHSSRSVKSKKPIP